MIKEKRWKKEFEKELREFWDKNNVYEFKKSEKVFSIDTPPPYPSGKPWHIGAVAHYSQIDMIARTARMFGNNVLFPVGIDRNGLPVEIYTEKKYNVQMHKISREKFVQLCKKSLDELEEYMIQILHTIGFSADFKNHRYRTDSEEYRKLTQATFIELWKKGLIYEDTRPNNYCVKTKTTIADAEIEYKEIETNLVYIKFKTEDGKQLVIATTRPELLGACAAILYNPNDERYKGLKGNAIVPIYGHKVPIIPHPYAKPEFGTGLVMICSYGDYADVRLFRELKLPEKILIDENGRMNKNSGKYEGLLVKEAREKITKDLQEMGLVEKIEKIMHRTPFSERGKHPIEIIPMKEYYLKQIPFLDDVRKCAEKIKFHPDYYKQFLFDWIDSVSIDWPITRRRFYGTEVPIWYCKKCGEPHVPEPGKYYQPWKQKAPFEKCKKCGNKEFVGDERTLDTWMDSSISALFISGYKRDEELFKSAFPVSLRPQAKEIIRTWLYYTILRVWQLTNKCVFKHVWIGGHGVDEHGKKMSKSLGNIVDPVPILEKYGADTFRFWNAAEANVGSDFRYSESRLIAAQKFLTKLWNLSRFISGFQKEDNYKLTASDEWIISELNKTIEKCKKGYEEFNFFIPANEIKHFAWSIFADHYIEMVKARAYNKEGKFSKEEQNGAIRTLYLVLENIIKLLAPICPFITEKIWLELFSKESIHKQKFPEKIKVKQIEGITEKLIEFNSEVWKYKKEKGMPLNSSIKRAKAYKELEIFKQDLIEMHNIEELEFGEKIEIGE
ncbi:MAG: valine--tRNA ligase [Nanoarchaeota archaeon]|nr:valine--tRNA ligase [Nanoarchaeota archaeon]